MCGLVRRSRRSRCAVGAVGACGSRGRWYIDQEHVVLDLLVDACEKARAVHKHMTGSMKGIGLVVNESVLAAQKALEALTDLNQEFPTAHGLREAGCICPKPLVGIRPGKGYRCRLCNAEEERKEGEIRKGDRVFLKHDIANGQGMLMAGSVGRVTDVGQDGVVYARTMDGLDFATESENVELTV